MSMTGRKEPLEAGHPVTHFPEVALGENGESLDHILSKVERTEILRALQRAEGRRTLAAQFLGISRSRLYRRMEALGIPMEESACGHS